MKHLLLTSLFFTVAACSTQGSQHSIDDAGNRLVNTAEELLDAGGPFVCRMEFMREEHPLIRITKENYNRIIEKKVTGTNYAELVEPTGGAGGYCVNLSRLYLIDVDLAGNESSESGSLSPDDVPEYQISIQVSSTKTTHDTKEISWGLNAVPYVRESSDESLLREMSRQEDVIYSDQHQENDTLKVTGMTATLTVDPIDRHAGTARRYAIGTRLPLDPLNSMERGTYVSRFELKVTITPKSKSQPQSGYI